MIDPIKFEVIRNALLEATEEMAIALRRSAYSTNIKTRADFSCAFFDSRLRVVAQAFAQPNHLGSFVELVPRALRTYGLANLGPGDAILTNDPYGGGVHLNDITLISPVYASLPAGEAAAAMTASPAVADVAAYASSPAGSAGAAMTSSPAGAGAPVYASITAVETQNLASLNLASQNPASQNPASPPHGPLLGYVASLAHHVDVGGGAPASIGAFREVFQEGVIIPPVRLVRAGHIVDDIFRLVLAQIRSKRETAGDFRAQIAANNTGARRLSALVDRMGLAQVREYIDELIAYTERRARAEIARLPRGVFAAEGTLDNDGFTDQPVRLAARIIIDDFGVAFDLHGCDPQRRAPVNATFAQTFSCCAYALKCLIDPDVPTNAGFYTCVRVDAPEGTVVNCTSPAPVVGGWETNSRLTDVIFKALAPVLPERMPAGTKAMICHAGFGGISPRTNEYYCFLETLAGGFGARLHSDGPDAVQTHGQNTENAPIEETERNYPLRIARYELVDDSEGPGRQRGGLGLRRDYLFPDHGPTFTILADRDRAGPWGLAGGLAGRRAFYVLNPGDYERTLSSKQTIELRPGDVISYRTCGGGGIGPPRERDPQLVLRDVRDGKVTAARARDVYGVALDATSRAVDPARTAALRAQTRGPDNM